MRMLVISCGTQAVYKTLPKVVSKMYLTNGVAQTEYWIKKAVTMTTLSSLASWRIQTVDPKLIQNCTGSTCNRRCRSWQHDYRNAIDRISTIEIYFVNNRIPLQNIGWQYNIFHSIRFCCVFMYYHTFWPPYAVHFHRNTIQYNACV